MIFSRPFLFLTCLTMCALPAAASPGQAAPSPTSSGVSTSQNKTDATASPALATDSPANGAEEYVVIPGSMRSFLRMAGISQKSPPEDVIPLLGHFVETYGYQGSKEKSPKPTEALKLFKRYMEQARALTGLAGGSETLQFNTCEESRPLLEVLGYRLKEGCRPDTFLEISDPEKAFITVDSGFPLVDLEQALAEGKPFRLPFASPKVPVIYSVKDWTGKSGDSDLIGALVQDPELSRLYWALSRVSDETRAQLRAELGVQKLRPIGSVIDFYGSMITIRDGRVIVPGGTQAEPQWRALVGAAPSDAGGFVTRLLSKDDGWLAEFYDAVSHAPEAQQAYLTGAGRLGPFYAALHAGDNPGAAVKSIFRPGANLLIFTSRLPLDEKGEPLVPGGLSVWKEAFLRRPVSKAQRQWGKQAPRWTTSDQLVQGLIGQSVAYSTNGPLDMYLTISEIDRRRPVGARLSAETAQSLVRRFAELHDQYEVFAEFPELNGVSIESFLKTTDAIDQIHDPVIRGDAMGVFEADLSLWQILARQGEIRSEDQNTSWQRAIAGFGPMATEPQIFDGGRAALRAVIQSASNDTNISQAKVVDLLAGPPQITPDGRLVHNTIASRISAVMTDQRLVSLDTIFALGDDLTNPGQARTGNPTRDAQLAAEFEAVRSPREMFTAAERSQWAPGNEPNRHILNEMRTDLKKTVADMADSNQAQSSRGALTPFLRDTLVGFSYAYYEPPGAEVLHNSPLLVRAHNFTASEAVAQNRAWLKPELFGIGVTAAQGTHLSGSLAGLAYTLAEVEQDFIVPDNVQALIWHDTAADLLTTSVVPRWWSTPQDDLHAAALYQRTGEELIRSASHDAKVRTAVNGILSRRLPSEALDEVESGLAAGQPDAAIAEVAPADTFYLAAEYRRQFPGDSGAWGAAGTELENLAERDPTQVDVGRLEREFGPPHPTLTESYSDEMLNLKPFPSVMDYASELLAESWESNNLYWARLADEMGYTPALLNELAPALTRRMVERIFGSDFDDWPALLRALRETGEEFRSGQMAGIPKATSALTQ